MKLDEILTLLHAGYTREEITAFEADPQQEEQENHEQEKPEKPKKKTKPMEKSGKEGKETPEEEADESGADGKDGADTSTGDSELESLRSELTALRESLHLLNIQRGGGKESKGIAEEIAEQWSRNPYEKKGK